MATVYLSTAYLAPVSYYCKLATYDAIVVEANENYLKQTYRNRCYIAGANGRQQLSIPVVNSLTDKCLTKDIRISDHGHWRAQHWHSLVSAYGMSPFFEFYSDDFAPFYEQKYTFLLDFNERLREMVCRLLDISPSVRLSEHYEPSPPNDFREAIRPKHPVPDPTFTPKLYYQVFASKYGFLPDLSIVDLLFNMGPEAALIISD
ncbi:MAG: WbqC family protein [Tannerella sp.]|jgi:hypothetical protein|nr:WbqC family protein [Tannerella sp.]